MIARPRDFWAGLMFAVTGAAFAWGSQALDFGQTSAMGPGWMPRVVGIALALLGLAITLGALRSASGAQSLGPWTLRPVLHIVGANFVFGLALGGVDALQLKTLGFPLAVWLLVVLAGRASPALGWTRLALLGTAIALGATLVFRAGLGMTLPLWPALA